MTGSRIACVLLVLLAMVLGSLPVEAGSAGKAVAKGAARGILRKVPVYRRLLGPKHSFRKEALLERYTNRPSTDKLRGLPRHSFWTRPESGQKGSSAHIQRKLNIPHRVERREVIRVGPGTIYHERPVKGGLNRSREVILEKRVPGKRIELKGRLDLK